ncbi:MAG: glycine cleavage system protein GcvH [Deltaproteobacteria bacterium]|nr:glycine cleavage system protein GcvH [Deltaproteobacteria bacterium]
MYKEDLKYSKTHEWVNVLKHHRVRMGITEYAQEKFGKILFVDIPEIDSEHEQFDSIAVIEAENALTEIDCPISGKIISINEEIDNDPTIINHDPYEDGWILELEIYHEEELDELMDYDEYQKFIEDGGAE